MSFFKAKLAVKTPKLPPAPKTMPPTARLVKIPQLKARSPFPSLYEHKWVMGTDILVDAFKLGPHPDCRAYFLTHFHSDHYDGLNGRWADVGRPIYASTVTKGLVEARLGLKEGAVTGLPSNTWVDIYGGIRVALIDAHHCPGSAMLLFHLMDTDKLVLHTGDFRASPGLLGEPFLVQTCKHRRLDGVYLDTTYCAAKHAFPCQEAVVAETAQFCRTLVEDRGQARFSPVKRLVLVGSYLVGKERVALAIARALSSKIYVGQDKLKLLELFQWEELSELLTLDPHQASVHLVSMSHVSIQGLNDYLNTYYPAFTHILGIRPTGWTGITSNTTTHDHNNGNSKRKGAITLHSTPYSEHSSYEELVRFLAAFPADLVIPTVDNRGDLMLRSKDFGDDPECLLEFWSQRH